METFKKFIKKGRDSAMALVTLGTVLSADAGNVQERMPPQSEDIKITSMQERFKPEVTVERNTKGEITSIRYNKIDENGYIYSVAQKGKMISISESESIDSVGTTVLFQKRDPAGNLILNYNEFEQVKHLMAGTKNQQTLPLTSEEKKIVMEQAASLITEARSQVF